MTLLKCTERSYPDRDPSCKMLDSGTEGTKNAIKTVHVKPFIYQTQIPLTAACYRCLNLSSNRRAPQAMYRLSGLGRKRRDFKKLWVGCGWTYQTTKLKKKMVWSGIFASTETETFSQWLSEFEMWRTCFHCKENDRLKEKAARGSTFGKMFGLLLA